MALVTSNQSSAPMPPPLLPPIMSPCVFNSDDQNASAACVTNSVQVLALQCSPTVRPRLEVAMGADIALGYSGLKAVSSCGCVVGEGCSSSGMVSVHATHPLAETPPLVRLFLVALVVSSFAWAGHPPAHSRDVLGEDDI